MLTGFHLIGYLIVVPLIAAFMLRFITPITMFSRRQLVIVFGVMSVPILLYAFGLLIRPDYTEDHFFYQSRGTHFVGIVLWASVNFIWILIIMSKIEHDRRKQKHEKRISLTWLERSILTLPVFLYLLPALWLIFLDPIFAYWIHMS